MFFKIIAHHAIVFANLCRYLWLDTEAVVLCLFKYLLETGRTSEISEFASQIVLPFTDEIRRLQALCLLANGNLNEAWQSIEVALPRNQENVFFQLTAAYIAFWQALPDGFHSPGFLAPQFFISDLFSLNDKQNQQMRKALGYLELALMRLDSNNVVRKEVVDAYLAVCVNLPDKNNDAIEQAKIAIARNPIDPAPVYYLLRVVPSYEWEQSIDVLSMACEQSNPPIWQIEMFTDILLHTGQTELAWQYLLRFESDFLSQDEKVRWYDRAIHSLLPSKRLSELESRISHLNNYPGFSRVKVGFWLRCGEDAKAFDLAKELANDPGTLLDLTNLVNLYCQNNMWHELMESASQCLGKYQETHANVAGAFARACIALDKPNEALAALKQYQPIFERDGLLIAYHTGCMAAYYALGQYSLAWEASELLWGQAPSEFLLVQRVNFQVEMGDAHQAVELIKQGIALGFETSQIFMLAAHYSLTFDREAAFQWAQHAIERFPNDPQLLLNAAMVGFNSGHSDWASMQMAIIRQDFPDSGLLQEVKLSTLLQWFREGHERSSAHWRQFVAGHLPIHLWLDSQHGLLSTEIYSRWHFNHSKPLDEHIPFSMAYGGRSVEPLVNNWQSRSIIMDYSACLMAHQLKLFPFLDKAFDVIYIAPSLFTVIQHELHKLSQVQSDLLDQAEQLLAHLKSDRLPFVWLPESALEQGDFSGLQHSDRILWQAALQNDLWIVEDHFATETLELGIIPQGLDALRITYADVLTAIQGMGDLLLEEGQLRKITPYFPDHLRIKQISVKKGLLVDRHFLEVLMKLDILEVAVTKFKVCCIEGLTEQLSLEIDEYHAQHKIKNWLNTLLSEFKRLQSKGKLKSIALQREPEKQYTSQKLTFALQEIILNVEQTNCPIWIDDRLLGSYPTVSQDTPILGVYDILVLLHSRDVISDGKMRESFRNLLRSGFGCRLPPIEYLMNELAIAVIDSDSGKLIENTHLARLRESVAIAFAPKSILNKKPLRPELMPEEAMFRLQLNRLIEAVMVEIWSSDKFDIARRIAMADWLYLQFLPQRGRPVSFGDEVSDPIQRLALEHSFRMSLPWQFANKPKAIGDYYRWLFAYIKPAWQNHAILQDAALTRFAEIIVKMLKGFLRNKRSDLFITHFTNQLKFLPDDIFKQLLAHPAVEQELKGYFTSGDYIENLDLFIPGNEWEKIIEACINLEPGNPLTRTLKGRKISLEFRRDKGIGDTISVSGQCADGSVATVSLLSPFCRLEHSVLDKRVQWLNDMTQAGLLEVSNSHREKLTSSEYHEVIDVLQYCCERSGDFFFAFGGLALNIDDLYQRKWEYMLPANKHILISISPNDLSIASQAEWLFSETHNHDIITKRLAGVAAFPFGEPYALVTIVGYALSVGLVTSQKLSELVDGLATLSKNPVTLQNLLVLYLRLPEICNLTQAEALIGSLLSLESRSETYEEFECYLKLLRLIWKHLQTSVEFKNCSYENRVIWAYGYADRMLDSMLHQNELDSNYWRNATKNIEQALATLQERHNPFINMADDEADVILPSAASWWRTVIGGTLSIIKKNSGSLGDIQNTVIGATQPLLNACKAFDISKLRDFDFLEPTDFSYNHKNSVISNQGWTYSAQIIAELGSEPLLAENYPLSFWQETLNIEYSNQKDSNLLISYFFLLSRHPILPEMVESLIGVVDTLIKDNSFNQDNQQLFLAMADLTGQIRRDRELTLQNCLIDKAIEALSSSPELWLFIPELILKLYRFDCPLERSNKLIDTMGHIAKLLLPASKEFSEFCAVIRNIEAYMPVENWHKLWNILE